MGDTGTGNSHSCGYDNPHETAESNFQHRFSVNVWCGISGNRLIEPEQLPATAKRWHFSRIFEE
jgi:hypothetical protein